MLAIEIEIEIEDEIHFLCYCPKYFKLRNEFFAQIQSHLHNSKQLSYSDLVIRLMKSEDIYLYHMTRTDPRAISLENHMKKSPV